MVVVEKTVELGMGQELRIQRGTTQKIEGDESLG
jgi:hypothetical protein